MLLDIDEDEKTLKALLVSVLAIESNAPRLAALAELRQQNDVSVLAIESNAPRRHRGAGAGPAGRVSVLAIESNALRHLARRE